MRRVARSSHTTSDSLHSLITHLSTSHTEAFTGATLDSMSQAQELRVDPLPDILAVVSLFITIA